MFEVFEKCPTRVDLAGGTLDCWPLYLFLDNPVTVNVAIDICTSCLLRSDSDDGRRAGASKKIHLISKDMKMQKTYQNLEECLNDADPHFEFYRAHLRYWRPEAGFTLETFSESPVGGGLGGSSSLCISILKAFGKWMHRKFEPTELVRIASHIEAQILEKPTGTQDYFPPIFGAINFIHYEVPGPRVEIKKIPDDVFEGRFLLVYTGKSHHSGINNWQVIKNYLDGDQATKSAMQRLAQISKDMQMVIEMQNYQELPQIFKQEFDARVALSAGFSSPEIVRLQKIASQEGAVAKICGAGGGGCVLIWCQNQDADRVAQVVAREGFEVLPAKPWSHPV